MVIVSLHSFVTCSPPSICLLVEAGSGSAAVGAKRKMQTPSARPRTQHMTNRLVARQHCGLSPISSTLRGAARHSQRERERWQFIAARCADMRDLLVEWRHARRVNVLEGGAGITVLHGESESLELDSLVTLRDDSPRADVLSAAVEYLQLAPAAQALTGENAACPDHLKRKALSQWEYFVEDLSVRLIVSNARVRPQCWTLH